METWEDTLTMSRKEVPRAGLVKAALAGQITNAQGAVALGLSVRQFQRLKRRFQRAGPRGLLHAGRGRRSSRALPPQLRARVAKLLQTVYRDVNDCHVTEKLREVEGLPVGRESVRQIRRALGLPAKHRRRPRSHRARRTPAAQPGALVLVDGSDHDWLEGRGPRLTLVGMLDDATGHPLALHFRPEEDLHGYLTLLAQLATDHGLPLAFYGDRLNVFVRNDAHWSLEEQLQGAQHPTQFGRILRELGIGYIAAGSPQAKGRIEKLWGTLQDRLVVELRLRGIATREAANAFLPPLSPTTRGASAALPPPPLPPGAARPPRSPTCSAVCIGAPWPAITPSASAPAGSRSRPGPPAAPTPAAGSRCASASMAACSSSTRASSWPGPRRRARTSSCAPASTPEPRTANAEEPLGAAQRRGAAMLAFPRTRHRRRRAPAGPPTSRRRRVTPGDSPTIAAAAPHRG